jgi:hypothetical protein
MTSERLTSIVHIGLHKTGSTSLQEFLGKNRNRLRSLNYDFYSGIYLRDNHVELHAAAMRTDRKSPFKLGARLEVDNQFRDYVRTVVERTVMATNCDNILFSAEGLSYLRFPDEFEGLRRLIPSHSVKVIVYRRALEGYRRSYLVELRKHNIHPTEDCESIAYVNEDSWLWRIEERIDTFRAAFGRQNVIVIDYDKEMAEMGNAIPSFLNVLGLRAEFREGDWRGYALNRSDTSQRVRD